MIPLKTKLHNKFKGHLPNKQGSSSNHKQYPLVCKLFLIYQRCECLQRALSTHVTVTALIYSSNTTNSYPLNPLIFTLSRSQKTLRNIPMVRSRDQNGFPFLHPFLSMFSRHENNFFTLCHHQVSCQTTSVKFTIVSLPSAWIFISHQSESRTSMKIFIHNSMPDILVVICISSRFVQKSAVHA